MKADVDGLFENEPTPLPPAPPTSENRINGLPADTWALMIERKIDALFDAQREALQQLADTVASSNKEVRDGFAHILEGLKSIERHEQLLRGQQQDINALDGKVNLLRDRMDVVERALAKVRRPKRARKKK